MKNLESASRKQSVEKKLKDDPDAQARAFRKAAREAGVDPDADVDEVMRRLAAQKKPPARQRKEGKP